MTRATRCAIGSTPSQRERSVRRLLGCSLATALRSSAAASLRRIALHDERSTAAGVPHGPIAARTAASEVNAGDAIGAGLELQQEYVDLGGGERIVRVVAADCSVTELLKAANGRLDAPTPQVKSGNCWRFGFEGHD